MWREVQECMRSKLNLSGLQGHPGCIQKPLCWAHLHLVACSRLPQRVLAAPLGPMQAADTRALMQAIAALLTLCKQMSTAWAEHRLGTLRGGMCICCFFAG